MDENRNLVKFKCDFIVAGVRTSIKSLYRSLLNIGAIAENKLQDEQRLNENKRFVLYCKNEYTLVNHKVIPKIMILSKEWWDYYHNKKINPHIHVLPTYNLPKQWQRVEELLVAEEIPTLFPEEA